MTANTTFKVTRVIDGDTIGIEIPVRLADLWAPELKAPGGVECLQALIEMLAGKRVYVRSHFGEGTWGRLVADVYRSKDALHVAEELDRRGLASYEPPEIEKTFEKGE